MHVNLVWNHMNIIRTWRNYEQKFDNLHRKISELMEMKTYKTLGFYHKTQTRTTKGTRSTLDLQKFMDSSYGCFLVDSHTQRRKEESFVGVKMKV